MEPQSTATPTRISTRELDPSARLDALRELFDRSIRLKIDAEPGHAVEMEMMIAHGLRRAKMLSGLTARVTRPAKMLADGEDTICLMMKTGGRMSLEQSRRVSVPQVGDGILLVYREPALLHFGDATYLSVRVPFNAIAPLANVETAAALHIRQDTEALSLLHSYVSQLPDTIGDPRLGQLTATHVYDLIALAIGATREGKEIANERSIGAARLAALKAELMRDITIDLGELAARQRISTRYVQKLFEEAGTTFSAFALGSRLDAARRMLTSPRYRSWSITEIALEAGFTDLSHFNRRFKQRFSMTPTDMRRHGVGGG